MPDAAPEAPRPVRDRLLAEWLHASNEMTGNLQEGALRMLPVQK